MARSIEILLREKDSGEARCGYCHDGFEAESDDEGITRCLGCSAPHHLDCWVEHSACAACGHPTPDREAEVRQLFRKVRQERLNRLRERYQQQRTGFSSSRWISLIFVVEVILALAVIVFGLLKDKSWVIVAYLAQGIALAVYFAVSDRQAPARTNQRTPARNPDPPPQPSQPERISERIRIRRVSPEAREDLIDTARLNAPEAPSRGQALPSAFSPLPEPPPPPRPTPTMATLIDFQPWPESAFRDAPSPTWLSDPQAGPPSSIFSNLDALPPMPASPGRQAFFPFHEDLDSEGEFIQRVSRPRDDVDLDPEEDTSTPTPLELLANPRLFDDTDTLDEFDPEDIVEERYSDDEEQAATSGDAGPEPGDVEPGDEEAVPGASTEAAARPSDDGEP